MDLKSLFNECNVKCNGCSILGKQLPQHSIMDYEGKEEVDILFVSDSFKMMEGDFRAFRYNEWKLISNELRNAGFTGKVGFTASVKCPNLTKNDVSAKDRKICRVHLMDTINTYKPKLVFTCGDLALSMMYGKDTSVASNRGKVRDFEIWEHKFKLVPLFHPYQVIAEPKNAYLFTTDITNSIELVIHGRTTKSDFTFTPIFSLEDLREHSADFIDTDNPVMLDIETTGLNFLEDLIQTIALSVLDKEAFENEGKIIIKKTIAFPIDHKENSQGLHFKAKMLEFVANVMKNKRNRKVGQKFNFDLKFLMKYGVTEVENPWDTKLMQHCYNEDIPKGLRDLVSYYYPNETVC